MLAVTGCQRGPAVDEAVALVVAAPIVALALWAVAFAGHFSNGQARSAVAAELAAQAAARARGPEAAATAGRIALERRCPLANRPVRLSPTSTPAGRPR